MNNTMDKNRSLGVFSFLRKYSFGKRQVKGPEVKQDCISPEECRRPYTDRDAFNVLY